MQPYVVSSSLDKALVNAGRSTSPLTSQHTTGIYYQLDDYML